MIRTIAHAKINLFLEITGKRADGYHTLSTVFQTISLGDELTLTPAAELSLTCSDAGLPTDGRNLVMKAAARLREVLRETQGAKIHLHKKVPMGAGLGGGSSDAAAVMRALLKLWKRRLPETRLAKLAVQLGADVPFFLKGGICAAAGIGEKLKPLKPLPKTWLVLVYPGFGVSTKEAYSKVQLPFIDPTKLPKAVIPSKDGFLFNRFESLVFPDHPELPQLKQNLLNAGATAALMSGSGSSVFGLARTRAGGEKILSRVHGRYPKSWLVHTLAIMLLAILSSRLPAQAADAAALVAQADAAYAKRQDVPQAKIAMVAYERAAAADPARAVECYWKASRAAWWLGEHEEARADRADDYEAGMNLAKKALALNPESLEGHFWLGGNLGSYGEAKGILKSLSLIKPIRLEMAEVIRRNDRYLNGAAYHILGAVDYKVPALMGGSKKRAKAELEKALAIGPNDPFIHYYLAEYAKTIGDQAGLKAELGALQTVRVAPEDAPELQLAQEKAARELTRR